MLFFLALRWFRYELLPAPSLMAGSHVSLGRPGRTALLDLVESLGAAIASETGIALDSSLTELKVIPIILQGSSSLREY